MENRQFIDQAKGMVHHDYTDESMMYYLKEAGAAAGQLPGIIETAKAEYYEERFKTLTKRNKLVYYLWLGLTILTFIVFLFVLPLTDMAIGNVFILSALGALMCCFFGFNAMMYRKSWTETYVRNIGSPKIRYEFLVILFVPGVILHFIFSFRFTSAQDSMLKETQVEVVGHVVDGNSVEVKRLLRGGAVDVSSITVEFETTEGQKLTVSKDVAAYQFKNFYKGQEIHLIYSKSNPRNIDLLADESSIRNFKNTQEREFEPTDLLRLVSVSKQDMTNELNKINYGWVYNASRNLWINEKRQSIITLNDNELHLIGKEDYNLSFPLYLDQNGFTMTNKEAADDIMHTGKKIFENKQFIFTVEAMVNQDEGHSIISVVRK
jgi:hypothetical protein